MVLSALCLLWWNRWLLERESAAVVMRFLSLVPPTFINSCIVNQADCILAGRSVCAGCDGLGLDFVLQLT